MVSRKGRRRSAIRSLIAIALALALTAGANESRADLVTYNMTGTVSSINSLSPSAAVAVGDRIAWTLQFDRATPSNPGGGIINTYSPNTPTILNIVDLTTGSALPSPPSGSTSGSQNIYLSAGATAPFPINGVFGTSTDWGNTASGSARLELSLKGVNPSLANLAALQLDKVPFDSRTFYYDFVEETTLPPQPGVPGLMASFTVQVDAMTAPLSPTPEPGSLTLCLLGAVGLAVRRLRFAGMS